MIERIREPIKADARLSTGPHCDRAKRTRGSSQSKPS